jgi:hypothetical protein
MKQNRHWLGESKEAGPVYAKWILIGFYSGCQKNVPVFKRFFSTTTYAAIP